MFKKNIQFLGLLITFSLHADHNLLDSLALKYETDKSSLYHDYTSIYEKYFLPVRLQSIKFLEIGLLIAASARMWEEYFPKAQLYFMDCDPQSIAHGKNVLSNRSFCYLADQGDKKSLEDFIQKSGGDFDIIIDDGGHKMYQQITSFITLFPHVKPGGVYIIEDLHTSYWASFGGHGSQRDPQAGLGTTVAFLQNLVDDLNFSGAYTTYADKKKYISQRDNLHYYRQHIESIHFYTSLCFIFKR